MTARGAARRAEPDSLEADTGFAADVASGLSSRPKHLAAKYFYDAAGSALFEEITRLPEYYPTRTELGILEAYGAEIAAHVPPGAALIEFGSGSSAKIRTLLRHLPHLAAYVPVDVSAGFLEAEAAALRADWPSLAVVPLAADFTQPFELPPEAVGRSRAGFFPGSTIGNFDPPDATRFLRQAGAVLGPGAGFIVGVDLVKDAAVLEAAYDDAAGVTGRFNLNLLARINRELGADFDLDAFSHRACFDAERSRIEMRLVSRLRQRVRIGARLFDFAAGETIHTENSYKYTLDGFQDLARGAGWRPVAAWTDAEGLFSVQALSN